MATKKTKKASKKKLTRKKAAKKPINDGLTVKQRKFVKYYLQSGNASEAARKAGYKNRQSAYENMTKPYIQDLFQRLLDGAGITDKKLMQVLSDGLSAMKLHTCDVIVREKNGKLVVSENSNDFIEIEDHGTRHRYLETALKLKQFLNHKDDGEASAATELQIYIPAKDNIDGWKISPISK